MIHKITKTLEGLACPVGEIHLDPKNAREAHDIDGLSISLNKYGQLKPIVANANENGRIIAGNGTYKAAVKLGWTHIAVVWVEVDPATATGFAIIDNRLSDKSVFNEDKLIQLLEELPRDMPTGFSDDDIQALLQQIEEEPPLMTESVEVVSSGTNLQEKWGTDTGQLWVLPSTSTNGVHRLVCADFTEGSVLSKLMRDDLADCIIAKFPTGSGEDYGDAYDDTIDNLKGILFQAAILWKSGVIVNGGFLLTIFKDIVNGRSLANADGVCEFPMTTEYWDIFRASNSWRLRSRRIVCEVNENLSAPWTYESNRGANNWSHLWTFCMSDPPIIDRQVSEGFHSNYGWLSPEVDYIKWVIGTHSRIGSVVYDPFCREGDVLFAAESLGRVCYATEMDAYQTAVILEKYKHEFELEPELADQW